MRGAVERAGELLGDLATADVPLGPLTTYRVGGRASLFVVLTDLGSATQVAEAISGSGIEVLVVGNGSNMLVADAGYFGLAVQLGEDFARIHAEGSLLRVGGGALLPVVARRSAALGLAGFEWAVGVPGSIGGAVRMNAGGHGSDMASCLRAVRMLDLRTGEDVEVEPADLSLAFRSSAIAAHQVVVDVVLELEPGEREESERQIAEVVRWRREHQPGGANAGSVFVNPLPDSAGRLVESAGCKGLRFGSAQVSTKHANFIQADVGGSAEDVWQLMSEVQERVEAHSGVRLRSETRLVGFGERAARFGQ